MPKLFLMGNEAVALGAVHAGVNLAAGYPGTPSTEILEAVAKFGGGSVYVEWSVNEKAALEVAAGASYCGARTLVTMKQVGLNVASDPLMSLAYIGVKGGMVIAVADDPGPISSQTEQDTRLFARFAKLPVFDPSSPEEAYEMMLDAFEYSEKYSTPVLLRPTTRVCHGCASVTVREGGFLTKPEGFVRDPARWVIFPRTAYLNHVKIERRNPEIGEDFSSYRFNRLKKDKGAKKGIACSGVSRAYAAEALEGAAAEPAVLSVATPHPFPERLALDFLDGLEEVLVLEELDPVVERELLCLCGKLRLNVRVRGKLGRERSAGGRIFRRVREKGAGRVFGP
jgi:indolepyruvate ferredoxin oxidoreductase alpha subunit